MNESLASWMISRGPRTDEHDQRELRHLVAFRESQAVARADHRTLVARIRERMARSATTDTADPCPA